MPDPAEQNFPSGDLKIVIACHTESQADYSDKQEYCRSEQVFAFSGEEILAKMHSVRFLFTKFTFLFTILILQQERYQSNFAESILIGYEK